MRICNHCGADIPATETQCDICAMVMPDNPPVQPAPPTIATQPARAKISSTADRIFLAEKFDDYRANRLQFISWHLLQIFMRCPAEFLQKMMAGDPPSEDTHAFLIGRAAHTLILEGEPKFLSEYTIGDGPINPSTEKPYGPNSQRYRDWAARQTGKQVIPETDATMLYALMESLRKHEVAKEILSAGLAEAVLRVENLHGFDCQGRLDWIQTFTPSEPPKEKIMLPGDLFLIADLKTCGNIDFFRQDSLNYGYLGQMAFYSMLLAKALGMDPHETRARCCLIAVEKNPPYRSGVFFIAPDTLLLQQQKIVMVLAKMADCIQSGKWPTGFEEPQTI